MAFANCCNYHSGKVFAGAIAPQQLETVIGKRYVLVLGVIFRNSPGRTLSVKRVMYHVRLSGFLLTPDLKMILKSWARTEEKSPLFH